MIESITYVKLIGYLALALSVGLVSYHYNKRFLEWLRFQSLGTRDYIVERLSMMFIDIPPQKILLAMFIGSVGLGLVIFGALIPQWFPAILFGSIATIAGWKAPRPVVDWLYHRRVRKFELQMVDGLSLMSNGLKSGLSIVQSIALVTEEMEDPIRQELTLVLSENKLGVSLEEAFNNLAKRVISDDVEMFVTSINILKETGGNLAETFDTIVNTIRERIKVENKISALTAQGLYQGIAVMCVPPILLIVFYQTDPDFMMPLFTTALGWVIIGAVMTLMVVAFFVIQRIVKIDV